MVRIYFTHPKSTYVTELEVKVIEWIKEAFKGYDIVNPNAYEIEDGRGLEYYKSMNFFFKLIEGCDLMLTMGRSDGVMKERIYALEHNISVIEVPESISDMRSYK